jgi:uncharacterized protein YutE (UPF0331/DUF86 family)/predicted nucleotidyltransferase
VVRVREMKNKNKVETLKRYFSRKTEVLAAFLFGSEAYGLKTKDSDIDIAVYFKPLTRAVECEVKRDYPAEEEIRFDLVRMLETDNLDLVVLNRAKPVLAFNILRSGIPLVIKDKGLYLDFYLMISREAEDFSNFMEDYLEIKMSSHSLAPETKGRLILRLDYLLTYLPEKDKFLKLDFDTYQNNPDQRRNLERWVENIANATIDIAKIILASEKKEMPSSYKDALLYFGLFFGLKEEEARKFSQVADLRNILAHEYLDVLYERIRVFLLHILSFYEKLIIFLKKYVKGNKSVKGNKRER